MSLGIAFKGPEGIVLAADSRVTLTAHLPNKEIFPASFDNATKLLRFNNQKNVGVITYGLGAMGARGPRTAHSYLPEFEQELAKEKNTNLSVQDFANKFSQFYLNQWKKEMPENFSGGNMFFLIGGYDIDSPYGKIFEVAIPSQPNPREWHKDSFGIVWGGQKEFIDRLINGFDDQSIAEMKSFLNLTDQKVQELKDHLGSRLGVPIPYQFLPLQDCVDLAIFLIRTTINLQNWYVGLRGVGGHIDVATVTKIEGLKAIQSKIIRGEKYFNEE